MTPSASGQLAGRDAGRSRAPDGRRSVECDLHDSFVLRGRRDGEKAEGRLDGPGHGDPFPLRLPPHAETARPTNRSLVQRQRRRECREFRVRESLTSLNALALNSVGRVTLPKPDTTRPLTASKLSVVHRVGRRVASFPSPTEKMSDDEALLALLKTKDLYEIEQHPRVPFDFDKVKILHRDIKPSPLLDRFTGEAAHFYRDANSTIERSFAEVQAEIGSGELQAVRPFWDEELRSHRGTRLRFLRRLLDMGLGTLRRRIRGKVGFFTVGKKDGMQRLVCDARMPNQFHRRAPKAHLGTPAALASLDLSEEARGRAPVSDATASEAELPHAATVDLTDSFYQFTVEEVCGWFGVDFPEDADTWGVDSVFNLDTGVHEAVLPDDQLFFCFKGLAMGWTFALCFCQSVMAQHVSAALEGVGGHGALIADRAVPPQVTDGSPAAAVYVDNATIIGGTRRDTRSASPRCCTRFRRPAWRTTRSSRPAPSSSRSGSSCGWGARAWCGRRTRGRGGCTRRSALSRRDAAAPAARWSVSSGTWSITSGCGRRA